MGRTIVSSTPVMLISRTCNIAVYVCGFFSTQLTFSVCLKANVCTYLHRMASFCFGHGCTASVLTKRWCGEGTTAPAPGMMEKSADSFS